MKNIFFLFLFIIPSICFSQWSTWEIPPNGRIDDIFFINDSIGWTAGGGSRKIYKTINGGKDWTLKFSNSKYLRSIEFATPSLGFCGSLDSSIYKTTDGGNTWIDIADNIHPKPKGICGLAAPSKEVIYGCGYWGTPAYIIKSVDGGMNWTSTNMSNFATALVDIHFTSIDTGFVTGVANPETDGGIVLYTTDGGINWVEMFKTKVGHDYIWKIQTPDNKNYYGSIESQYSTGNIRYISSHDSGMTWSMDTILNTYSRIQAIGFIDSLRGWMGWANLYETLDGGSSWNQISLGDNYNRFFKLNDSTAFLSGLQIYKYRKNSNTEVTNIKRNNIVHTIMISPNPIDKYLNINLNIKQKTFAILELFSMDGKLLKLIYKGKLKKGNTNFEVNINKSNNPSMFVSLRTNEGYNYKVIVQK